MADPAPPLLRPSSRPTNPLHDGRNDESGSNPTLPREPWDEPEGLGERLQQLRRRLGLDGRLVAWAAAALVAVAVGAWLLRPTPAPFEETIPTASSAPVAGPGSSGSVPGAGAGVTASTSAPPATEVVAHAAGAVAQPGVYRLDPTARVDDLVRAAGGLAPDADGARINLAAPLTDGARVYVPTVGEEVPAVAEPDGPPTGTVPDAGGTEGGGSDDGAPGAPIDINTASEEELDELPGVGPAIAAAIIAYRTENGGFSSVDELLDVSGIGEAKLAEITPLATV